jgi:hypothetical protein
MQQRLTSWVEAFVDHFAKHAVHHVAPLGLVLLGLVLFGWGILVAWLLIFAGTVTLAALELEGPALIWFFGSSALGSLFMVGAQLMGAVLMLGYSRMTLRLQQGHETSLRELLWGFRHPLRSFGLIMVLLVLVLASAGLLYLPLLFFGGWVLLSAPSLTHGDRGLFGSLGRAWRLSAAAYIELLLLALVAFFGLFFLYFMPILGPALVPVLGTIGGAVIYDCLMKEQR